MRAGDNRTITRKRLRTLEMQIFIGQDIKRPVDGIQPGGDTRVGDKPPGACLRFHVQHRTQTRRKVYAAPIVMMFVERKTHLFMRKEKRIVGIPDGAGKT